MKLWIDMTAKIINNNTELKHRLKMYRKYLGLTQKAFCTKADIKLNSYISYENKDELLSPKVKDKILSYVPENVSKQKRLHIISRIWLETGSGNMTEFIDERSSDYSIAYRISCIIRLNGESLSDTAYYLHMSEITLKYLLKETNCLRDSSNKKIKLTWDNEYLRQATISYFTLCPDWFDFGNGTIFNEQSQD